MSGSRLGSIMTHSADHYGTLHYMASSSQDQRCTIVSMAVMIQFVDNIQM